MEQNDMGLVLMSKKLILNRLDHRQQTGLSDQTRP
jgi:hypothetical protein